MEIDKKNWLPHLNNLPKDIQGYKTCTYLIALEGWRRGLKLKFHLRKGLAIPPSIRFSLSNGEREHFFTVSRGDKVTNEAIKICMEKQLTYKYLAQNNIPIPEGKNFSAEIPNEEITNYAQELGFPLVIKPSDAGSGRGVITNINSLEEFNKAVERVRDILGYKNVIVERFIKGEDYRIYVVGDEVVGAYKRIPANIIGNGKSTIKELIKEKNKIRKKNPFIEDRPIVINRNLIEFLEERGLSLEFIPAKNERVFLRKQGEYLKERDPVDITDSLSKEIKSIAVKAMKSIPGLTHCDVDMLVNEETGQGFVNEINSRPQISNHLFPLEGVARDIPRKIIDYYFPETINGERNDLFYYDFKPVYESFKSMGISEITIPDIPMDHKLTRFRIKGNLKRVSFEKWIKRHIGRLDLNGYIKYLKNKEISIVVSGTESSLKKFRNVLFNNQPRKSILNSIKEYERNAPITIGFEIYNKSKKKQKDLENEVTKLKVEHEKVLQELDLYKNQYNNIVQSKSWRFTKLFRNIKSVIKK